MPVKNKRKTFPGTGMTAKQMRRKKPINLDHLKTIEPLTDNQRKVFDAYAEGKNLCIHGAAGTGKTFISLYLAMQQVLDPDNNYEKIYMVRSLVPTREIGFLPGDHEDKSSLYQIPYKNMSAQKCSALLNSKYTIKHNLDSFTLFLRAQNEYKFLILSLFPFSPFY